MGEWKYVGMTSRGVEIGGHMALSFNRVKIALIIGTRSSKIMNIMIWITILFFQLTYHGLNGAI